MYLSYYFSNCDIIVKLPIDFHIDLEGIDENKAENLKKNNVDISSKKNIFTFHSYISFKSNAFSFFCFQM